jgi:hypothetical protein
MEEVRLLNLHGWVLLLHFLLFNFKTAFSPVLFINKIEKEHLQKNWESLESQWKYDPDWDFGD